MEISYIFLLVIFLILSFTVPFAAFIAIPIIYIGSMLAVPYIVYSKLGVYPKKARVSVAFAVFLLFYLPVFWNHIPTLIMQKFLCLTSPGVEVSTQPWTWHKYAHVNATELQKMRRPLKDISKRIWTENNVNIYQNEFGYITKVWAQDGKEYTQKVNGIVVEKQGFDMYFVGKEVSKIIRIEGNVTLATMTTYCAKKKVRFVPREFQFWMPTCCSDSYLLEKWFDSLVWQYSTPFDEWR
jgi:hypothetical protein